MAVGGYRKASDLPLVIPVFPLDGALLLPGGLLPLNIFEPRYLNMIDDAMAGDRMIGMIQTREGGDRERPNIVTIGCAGRITSFAETQDGRYLVSLTGVCRFEVVAELGLPTPYRQVRADFSRFEGDLRDPEEPPPEARPALFDALKRYLDRRGLAMDWEAANDAPLEALVNSLAAALPFDPSEKQALLEAADPEERRFALIALMQIDSAGPMGDDVPPSMQ